MFHGSAPENWYSILRNGIRILSNTKYMTAGAALGAGVYAASQVNIYLNLVYDFIFLLYVTLWSL